MVLTRIRRALAWNSPRSKAAAAHRALPAVEEFEPRLVPVCTVVPTQCYLSQLYRDLLRREIDPAGLTSWTAALNSGFSRDQVALAITGSLEYRELLVQDSYNRLLGRAADTAGLNVFTLFLGAGGSVQQMDAAIYGSPEYSLQSGNASVPGFLQSLYLDALGRPIDTAGEIAFSLLLAGGASRGAVAQIVVTSVEAATNLVTGYYTQYLHRTPDTGGLVHFVTLLEAGARQQGVLSVIVGSAEYFANL